LERITACEPRSDFKLWLRFTDGSEGVVDLTEMVGKGIFADWSEPAFFNNVQIDPMTRTVCWPNGIELDPDVLYANVTGKAIPGSDAAA
jgi:hypothetical protein